MNQKTITLFGATGKIGIEVLNSLSQANIETLAVTRDKRNAVTLPWVEWVQADMTDPASLASTMRAGGRVFLLSPMSEHMVRGQTNVIEAAQRTGVAHIVKLSSGAVDPNSSFPISRAHGQIEAILQQSGLDWTMLRPNGFMQNWLGELAHSVRQERIIYEATGEGKRAYIDLRDIAEVAVRILTQPQGHQQQVYFLTGGEAISYTQLASYISRTIGQTVTYAALTSDQARQRMEQKGLPAWMIDTFLAYAQDQRNGLTASVSNAVNQILGKPARTVEAFVQEYAQAFT